MGPTIGPADPAVGFGVGNWPLGSWGEVSYLLVMLESAALVSHVGVSDLDRAQRFYGETLGLQLRDERPFALVAYIEGATLRISAVGEVVVAPYTTIGWIVSDIDSAIDDLVGRGVTFARYEGLDQDHRGVWTAPGGARIAWFLDPDSNNLSLTELANAAEPAPSISAS
jgi:catechol 2,3-dioxygenase-like lactoylglutathione lyase family enzyme